MTYIDHFKHHDLVDYAKASCNKTLADSPLNEADIALLTEIFYLPFNSTIIHTGLDSSKGVSLKEVDSSYQAKAQPYLSEFEFATEARVELFSQLAHSARFGEVIAYGFRQKIDRKKGEHFSTVIFEVIDNFKLLVFRGAESDLMAWQEDFSLSVVEKSSAHTLAKESLSQILEADKTPVLLAGHARGANLALHAAYQSSTPQSIQQVYLFDPLALKETDYQHPKAYSLIQKTQIFQAQSSFVERPLATPLQSTIVTSAGIGLMQHLLLGWSVSERGSFITHKAPSSVSLKLKRAIRHFFKIDRRKADKTDVKAIFSSLIKPEQREQVATISKKGSHLLMTKAQPLVE